ncbi:hypothetical protein C7B65_12015 [Phormidesmis priestleyi ULC007]|uniref:DUF2281 domain-containing protein n=1 Tax=Phormidesmis priestleyi ULC007 TaxID=1920490 RepID=A0A2T1DFV6_9CYAN|nr:hypothetical protein [Phormidesmis priestleyi]PSB19356.1 hypothetical protein C7B65_12015 [Phormidesmis priestleyi ULC007]PZO52271.1 MAG: hypothetical protein DCF14_06800 [Phormidesmis priestleyi]
MTPQLEAAIVAIQPLSPTERQQLIQILVQSIPLSNSQSDLETLNAQFRQGITLRQLLATQTPKTVHDPKDLAADFWSEEDSIEDFLDFLRQQRQALI